MPTVCHPIEAESGARLLSRQAGGLATAALIEEPRVWPRFGLVGPDDPGGHRDMNYADLVLSARVLESFFADSAHLGLTSPLGAVEAARLWRFTGLAAERQMYRATGGVNTHKGAIFLLGLIAFAWGRAVRAHARHGSFRRRGIDSGAVLDIAHRVMAGTLADEQRSHRARFSETYGQWAQRRFQWGGMRHTVLSDFHCLRRVVSLRWPLRGFSRQSQLAVTRHHLFLTSQDTNLLKRAGWRAMRDTLGQARHSLRLGGALTAAGRQRLKQIDHTLATRRWSASGTGDLLAAFLFLDGLERVSPGSDSISRGMRP